MTEKPISINSAPFRGKIHLSRIPTALLLGDPAAIGRHYNKEEIETFLKRHNITHIPSSRHKHALNLSINTGKGSGAWHDIKRTFRRKDKSLIGKLLAIPTIPASLAAKFSGSDHYDPNSHSVNVYGKSPAVLAHEIGHAISQSSAKHPTLRPILRKLMPGGTLREERTASHHAMKMLSDSPDYSKQDIQRASRKLHAAYGTYAAGAGLAALGTARKLINLSKDERAKRAKKREFFEQIPIARDIFRDKRRGLGLRLGRVAAVRKWRMGKVIDKHTPTALRQASQWIGKHHKPVAAGVLAAAVLGGHLLGRHRAKKWIKEHHKDNPDSMLELPATRKGLAAASADLHKGR